MVADQTCGSLEVMSEERFQQCLAAMASKKAAPPCLQCLRERARHHGNKTTPAGPAPAEKRRHHRKAGRAKRPIVVRLKDSIKVSVLSEWDLSTSSSSSSSSEESSGRSTPANPPPVVVNVGRQLKKKPHPSKNFNAFLSAIEKVHMKDLREDRRLLSSTLSDKATPLLNNALSHESFSKARSLGSLDGIDLICNDLHSDLSPPPSSSCPSSTDSGEQSDDTDSVRSCSPSSSGESSVSGEERPARPLRRRELERLRAFTEGCPFVRYDCPPHQCSECLATYSRYYKDALPADQLSDCSSSKECPAPVTVVGPGRVQVSVARVLHQSSSSGKRINSSSAHGPSSISSSGGSSEQRRDSSGSDCSCSSDSVVLDLSDTPMVYTVHYEEPGSPAAHHHHQQQHPDAFFYHFYWAMFGYAMYPPMRPFYLPPPAYYHSTYPAMAPMTSTAPQPLSRSHMHPAPASPGHPVAATTFGCSSKCPLQFVPFFSWQPSPRLWAPTLHPSHDFKHFATSQPPQRPWIPLAHPETNRPIAIYTVMCYNVLCDKYATRQLYGYCPSWALNWEYRKKIILEEIRQYSADIISLQEVETDQFYNFFLPELKLDGYHGIFSPKSRARTMVESERKHVDGCAIFYRTSKFGLIKEHLVEFNQVAIHTAEGSADMINRVMTKDNIGLAALLETKEAIWENGVPPEHQRQPILVATCHVHWDPEFCDVKLIQTMMLMNELKNIIEETQTSLRPGSTAPDSNSIPLILCGDLNSLPESGVVEYLTTGHVDANHRDFKDIGYEECLRKLSNNQNKDIFAHAFKLSQAYSKDVMPYTNYTFDFKGIIDYIFYSRDFMRPLGLLGPLDQEWFRENKVFGCPHPQIPSDHLPLLVEFEMGSSSSSGSTSSSTSSSSSSRAPSSSAAAAAASSGSKNSSNAPSAASMHSRR